MTEKPDAEAYVVEVIDGWTELGGSPADLFAAMENLIADVWAKVQSK